MYSYYTMSVTNKCFRQLHVQKIYNVDYQLLSTLNTMSITNTSFFLLHVQ